MLVFAIFSSVLGMFQFGFNTGVINAPEQVNKYHPLLFSLSLATISCSVIYVLCLRRLLGYIVQVIE